MTLDALEDRLSEPTDGVHAALAQLEGDVLVLGAAGKMGPSLARMAKRAAGQSKRIIAVSRFTSPGSQAALEAHGIDDGRIQRGKPGQWGRLRGKIAGCYPVYRGHQARLRGLFV